MRFKIGRVGATLSDDLEYVVWVQRVPPVTEVLYLAEILRS